jgi:hypothetical protein
VGPQGPAGSSSAIQTGAGHITLTPSGFSLIATLFVTGQYNVSVIGYVEGNGTLSAV